MAKRLHVGDIVVRKDHIASEDDKHLYPFYRITDIRDAPMVFMQRVEIGADASPNVDFLINPTDFYKMSKLIDRRLFEYFARNESQETLCAMMLMAYRSRQKFGKKVYDGHECSAPDSFIIGSFEWAESTLGQSFWNQRHSFHEERFTKWQRKLK